MDLAVDAIAKAENVEASDEEVDAEYDKMAEQYGMKAERSEEVHHRRERSGASCTNRRW